MQLIIENHSTTIKDVPDYLATDIIKLLTYTDKSKQYQIKRMSRNPFSRNSSYYKKLQSEVNGCLATQVGSTLVVPSGIASKVINMINDSSLSIIDNRKETGAKVSLPWINKPYDLRDFQDEAVSLMLSNYRGVINFATGLGKTLVAIHLIKQYKKRALIVCPSESIAKQFYDQLVDAFGKTKIGFYGGGKKKINDITVGIAASVAKDVDKLYANDLGLVIFDECHHTPAITFYKICEGLGNVGKMFGLTATDFRSDGKDIFITAGCGDVLIRRDIIWGIANKWLAEPYFIVKNIDTSHKKDFRDDKLKNYKEHILNCDEMKQQIASDMKKFMDAGKYVLCLVDEVAHGAELAKQLNIPFATGIDSKSQDYVDDLNAGKIQGLIGTDGKVGEGTDTKRVDVLILANFVASKGPVVQAIGRGLRLYGDKKICIVLDYIPTGSQMLSRHALGRIKMYQEITDKVKVC